MQRAIGTFLIGLAIIALGGLWWWLAQRNASAPPPNAPGQEGGNFVVSANDPAQGIPIIAEDSAGPLWKRKIAEAHGPAATSARVEYDRERPVRVRNGDRETFVRKGDLIGVGSTVYADDLPVFLAMGERGPRLHLAEGGELHIARLEHHNTGLEIIFNVSVELRAGVLRASLGRFSPASELLIRTTNSVVLPYGSFELTANGKASAQEGWLEVITDTEYFRIEAGQTYQPGNRQ